MTNIKASDRPLPCPIFGARPRLGSSPVKPSQTKMKLPINPSNRKLNILPGPALCYSRFSKEDWGPGGLFLLLASALVHRLWSIRVKPGQTKFSVTDPLIHYWVKPGKTKTEPVAHTQLLGFRSGQRNRPPGWSQHAVKPGKTKMRRQTRSGTINCDIFPPPVTCAPVKPGKTTPSKLRPLPCRPSRPGVPAQSAIPQALNVPIQLSSAAGAS